MKEKIQFNIKYRPHIESGEYKVVCDHEWPIEIVKWNCANGYYPILAIIHNQNPDGKDFTHFYNYEGKYDPGDSEVYCPGHDLYIEREVIVPSYLDAQEKRIKALGVLKDKMIELVSNYVECCGDDHPARQESNKEKQWTLWKEICWRKQDYDTFMLDYEKDWELNYNDYGIN